MQELYFVAIFLFILFLLLGSGVWIGLALLGVAYVGMELFTIRPPGDAMMTVVWRSASSWSLTALPMFIWMGEILFRTRLSEDMFKGLAPWMAKLPGGLLHTNVVGCTVFAAVSGSSAATLLTVGKMSVPELRKRNASGLGDARPDDPPVADPHRLRRDDQRIDHQALHRGHHPRPRAGCDVHGLCRADVAHLEEL
jgi:TRAP-type mannitol/chloroaromatic compound transport system permease large subunit